ncbi:MAG: heat-inducible transcription repressor HrcA [Chloroflexi bacterium]|nr:heat-inducible transcription repressor HrcA [Chloroflexota bacterium]
MARLTERQETIMALVAREYVATGMPVGSQRLIRQYDLGVSAATVRSEMAQLESMGYLAHPHTSAGRMPTEQGYRYFVAHLMREAELPLDEQRLIRHQFHQANTELRQWLKLGAAVLAHMSQLASLVTAPKAQQCCFKHLELVSVRDGVVLLVVVLSEDLVRQRYLSLPDPYLSRDELIQSATLLSNLWENKISSEIAATSFQAPGGKLARQIQSVVIDIMKSVDQRTTSEIYRDGMLQVLQNPEFSSSESLRQIMTLVEERQLLEAVLGEAMAGGEIQVIIGGEGRWPELSDLSIVIAPYGYGDDLMRSGVMGIIGPMRMPYQRNISTVRFVSDLMTMLLGDLYGHS